MHARRTAARLPGKGRPRVRHKPSLLAGPQPPDTSCDGPPEGLASIPPAARPPPRLRVGDDVLRSVAILRMEGETTEAIAAKLGCARRTVARQLALIRRI